MGAAEELGQIPLFASLDDAQRRELASGFSVKTAEAGSHLIGEGSRGYSFFVLLEGTADVSARGATIAQLRPGDFFGEIAIIAGGRRTASVVTTSHARLLVLTADEFRRLGEAHPAIAAQIERTMHERTDQPRDRPAR